MPIELPRETDVYIVLGVDIHEHDQVLAVFASYDGAKRFCIGCAYDTEYFDLWIERHTVI